MRTYGLIGYPLTHSFSEKYFINKFHQLGIIDAEYFTFSIPSIDELNLIIKTHQNLCGFNITIPYKKQILAFLNDADDIVKAMNACNCVIIKDEQLIGYNTDVIGFELSLKPFLKPHHNKALILGTGGAAAAVEFVFKKLNINYQLVSRNSCNDNLMYSELNESILSDHTLIINTSPVGQFPANDQSPSIPYQFITSKHHLFDLIYNPVETSFLQKGKAMGASTQNGYEMLLLQAEESWRIWSEK